MRHIPWVLFMLGINLPFEVTGYFKPDKKGIRGYFLP
jgi:hypothetical protein